MNGTLSKINALTIENAELKGKVEILEKLLDKVMRVTNSSSTALSANDEFVKTAFATMTCKQRGALEMILRGASNSEIANRFEVTESTAKLYVKEIMDRLDVRSRDKIINKAFSMFDKMDPDEYKILSVGVPKDWDSHHMDFPDVSKRLFEKTRGAKCN